MDIRDLRDLDRLLRSRRRAEAETVIARVVERRDDGDYMVMLRDTRGIVKASRGNIVAPLQPGQMVILSRPESSGRSINTGYTIISAPPASMKGASNTTPTVDTRRHGGVTIALVTPNPVEIAAGSSEDVAIYGSGLASTTAITYGSPDLSTGSRTDVSSEQIDLTIHAAGAATPGVYDLIVGGQRVRGEIHVTPSQPLVGLWVGDPNNGLYRVNYDTLVREEGPFTGLGWVSGVFGGMAKLADGSLFALIANYHLILDAALGETDINCTTRYADFDTRVVFEGTKVYYGLVLGNLGDLTEVVAGTTGFTNHAIDAARAGSGILKDGDNVWMAFQDRLYIYNLVSTIITDVGAPANRVHAYGRMDQDATYVYVADHDNNRAVRIKKSDLAITNSAAFGGAGTQGRSIVLDAENNVLYAVNNFGRVAKIDPSDMSVDATLDCDVASIIATDICIHGDFLYVCGDNGTFKISKASFTVVDSTADAGSCMFPY